MITIDEFRAEVRAFADVHLPRRDDAGDMRAWGTGSDAMVVIEEPDPGEEEHKLGHARMAAAARTSPSGVARGADRTGRTWPRLGPYRRLSRCDEGYATPDESPIAVGLEIVGPAILVHGSDVAKRQVLHDMHIGEAVGCQLFSEPNAGSDLSSVRARGQRVDGGWLITGQKVWTSGAHLATVGEALVRTDPDSERHRGLSMVLVDMTSPGVDVRPLRQMTGGCSFNEVFLDEVFVADEMVLDVPGAGWDVARTTLMQERLSVGAGRTSPAAVALDRLHDLVDHLGLGSDPIVRQRLTDVIIRSRVSNWFQRRAIAADDEPGPEMSIGKIHFTSLLTDIAELACEVLGPAVIADTGGVGDIRMVETHHGRTRYAPRRWDRRDPEEHPRRATRARPAEDMTGCSARPPDPRR